MEGNASAEAPAAQSWEAQGGLTSRERRKEFLVKSALGVGEAISGSWRKGTAVDLSVILFLDGSW